MAPTRHQKQADGDETMSPPGAIRRKTDRGVITGNSHRAPQDDRLMN